MIPPQSCTSPDPPGGPEPRALPGRVCLRTGQRALLSRGPAHQHAACVSQRARGLGCGCGLPCGEDVPPPPHTSAAESLTAPPVSWRRSHGSSDTKKQVLPATPLLFLGRLRIKRSYALSSPGTFELRGWGSCGCC